jgi:hypothetical protein|tara:strand:- start:785 stop:1012 length:228 start_codon:yes stop_codon:yes gene_type:complete
MIERTFKRGKKKQWRIIIFDWVGLIPRYTYRDLHGTGCAAYSKTLFCIFFFIQWDYNHSDPWSLEEMLEEYSKNQ